MPPCIIYAEPVLRAGTRRESPRRRQAGNAGPCDGRLASLSNTIHALAPPLSAGWSAYCGDARHFVDVSQGLVTCFVLSATIAAAANPTERAYTHAHLERRTMLEIVVCVRQILDPETPAKSFRLDADTRRAIPPEGSEPVTSDYDENAVEAALQIKDSLGANVTILSLGPASARTTIRRCIAMGADAGVLLSDPAFDDADSYATAFTLAEAIKKIGKYDLILCGRQEGDWDAGQVGSGIAELLALPSVTMVAGLSIEESSAEVRRVAPDGSETIEVPLPAVLTVSSEIGEPRYPSVRRIRQAFAVDVPTWTSADVASASSKNKMVSLLIPRHEAECRFIEAETPEEKGSLLALALRNAKVL
jgi:electron transfer flavoprotein beta subunit